MSASVVCRRQENLADGAGRALTPVHDALHVYPDVGVLEAIHALPAPMALRKERKGIAGELVEAGVVRPAREWHREVRRGGAEGDD